MTTKQHGSWGEAIALDYLRDLGYEPVGMGYTTRYGEIDLIVSDRAFIVFAEVKVRKNKDFGEAREFVGARKQDRLRKTAAMWLSEHDEERQPRFDVVEIYAPDGMKTTNPEIIHIEDAF